MAMGKGRDSDRRARGSLCSAESPLESSAVCTRMPHHARGVPQLWHQRVGAHTGTLCSQSLCRDGRDQYEEQNRASFRLVSWAVREGLRAHGRKSS
eukprot:scaffold16653_cov118-Isochrysis_galbana.AAC.5